MQVIKKPPQDFLNPYRQNKRCFTKYFTNPSLLNISSSKNSHQDKGKFLDNVSRASSVKFRQQSIENQSNKKSQAESQFQESHFVIMNKRKTNELQNPEMFELLSKHIQIESFNKKSKKILSKPVNSLVSTERMKIRSNSVHELQKTPKISEFSSRTFYRNLSSTRRESSSKKQKQDFLHSKSNFDINTKKHVICKKTRPFKQSRSFITYEIYDLNRRVGIDVQILAAALQQNKFRLIMSQSDTKTFHNHWIEKIDDFIDKCLVINEDGISLKVGAFNYEAISKKKSSLKKHIHKVYLEHYECMINRKNNNKVTKKIGHINFSQEYQLQSRQEIPEKQIEIQNLEIYSNQKEIMEKQNQESILFKAQIPQAQNSENQREI